METAAEYGQPRLGSAPRLEIPGVRPRPPASAVAEAKTGFACRPATEKGLRSQARRLAVDVSVIVLAAFAALLGRYADADDIMLDVLTRDGRIASVRVDLSGDPRLSDVVRQVVARLAGAPEAEVPGRLLFGVASADVAPAAAAADLALILPVGRNRLRVSLHYQADHSARAAIRRMAAHLAVILRAAARDADQSLSRLPLLTRGEWSELVRRRNAVAAAGPVPALGVHELFLAQARRTPRAVAASCGESSLTYAELAERASRLASYLRDLGVGPESVVGVAVPRSTEMVVALLAIWQAGGAYLPLDPDYPAERLAFMVADSGTRLVLGTRGMAANIVSGDGTTIFLDDPRTIGAITRQSAAARSEIAHPEQLAYVIYTSGSTGQPKGVEVGHRGVVNRLLRMQDLYQLTPDERVVHKAPLAFDASVWELFWPLSVGAELVIVEPGRHRDLGYLLSLIQSRQISVVHFVPSLFRLFADLPVEALTSLRLVFCSGEALAARDVVRFYAQHKTATVGNLYGPTETSIESVSSECERPFLAAGPPPIGRAIGNVRLYVLDTHLNVVPTGAPGELFIGGVGVGRGYRGRPRLTAERFVPDLFVRDGSRLYRTGDRVRWRADGQLDYLGRVDHQVKVRGVRIEPGEVEAALRACPEVADTVVVAWGASAERRLIAYLVPVGAQPPTASDLRAFLRARLPDYLIPSTFVALAALPLNPSGKVDRAALPEPGTSRPMLVSAFIAPGTAGEVALADIWATVLGLDEVGVTDNFFDLGGHSLAATQVASRVRAQLGVELPVSALFDRSTIRELAADMADGTRAELPAITPADRGAPLPLSFAQQRLWFLNQLEPESAEYNEPLTLRLTGELDVPALAAALDAIVARHEVLRTRLIADADGIPHQVIGPVRPAGLDLVDLSGAADPSTTAYSLFAVAARQPFDLAAGPLLRARLIRVGPDDHVLGLCMHHVVCDEWSVALLRNELLANYGVFRRHGQASPAPVLAPLAAQYADFARWQRQWLRGEVVDRQLAYWRDKLSGAPVLELPTDRPRPPVRSSAGARLKFAVAAETTEGLRALARSVGATMFMALFAVYAVLLGRLADQDDVMVGTPIANRNHAETEELIGFFVNTLVLRTDLSGDPAFTELLAQVRTNALAAYNHQDLPFEQLIDALNADRDRSRTPLFQALFNYNQADVIGGPPQPAHDLGLAPAELPGGVAAKFDLRLIFDDAGGSLTGAVEYATALFDPSTIGRLVERLLLLLAAVAADGGQRLSRLPAMPDAERRQIAAWNDVAAPAWNGCLPELIAAQATRNPDVAAVSSGDALVTYAELDARASQVAHYLRSAGVGTETVVGLCLDTSAEMLTAMLAVWKTGAVYLPLDPRHPSGRLEYMLADSRASILLSDVAILEGLPAPRIRTIALDDPQIAAAIRRQPATSPATRIHPGQAAYINYTSGSTGRPKGVWITHRSLAAYIGGVPDRVGFGGTGRRYALLQSVVTDFANTTVFACLSSGGTLCIPRQDIAADAAMVRSFLRDQRIDYLKIVPSQLAALSASAGLAELMPARALVLGGEAASAALAAALAGLAGDRVVVNHYGPTETTVGVATSAVDGGSLRIGLALPGDRLYVVDRQLNQVPIGVTGELYVGGTGVARGYGGHPGLTAERFIADPFAGDGTRLYRTGDRARRWPDGRLQFLGRIDQQIKIRGHRVEPAEIEAALLAHPGVAAAVVVARQDAVGRQLVAYLAPAVLAEGFPAADGLRSYLRRTLPDHMVPAAFVTLPQIPLGSNGKIDRAALPAPGAVRPELAAGYRRPRTPNEEMLAAIWTDILGIDQVGRDDNFFDLGGHSLLATQVISRIRSIFEVEPSLAALFDHPTVAKLATVIEAAAEAAAGGEGHHRAAEIPMVTAVSRGHRLPLSFAQQRLWFLSQLSPGSTEYNNADAIRLRGALDGAALTAALNAVVERHEVLRTRLVADPDGVPYQVVDPPSAFPLTVCDLSEERDPVARARELLAADSVEPFDLAVGTMARGRLVRLGTDDHVLCLCMHHVVSDEWSALILRNELTILYDAFRASQPSPLAPLPVQYADFAAWQREWLNGEVLDRQLSFWRDRLSDAPVLELPADHPRPAVRSSAGALLDVVIPVETAVALRAVARKTGATLFMTLLSAFTIVLGRYAGQDDVVLGSPIANRTRTEIEPLLGFFVNTLVLRSDLSGDPAFTELVERVRREALSAYAHQDVPFEQLVDALQPERDRSRTPLFGVLFSMGRLRDARLAFSGLVGEPFAVGAPEARFDLTLELGEDGDAIAGSLLYSTELFEPPTMRLLAGHLGLVLGAVGANSQLRLSEISLLTEQERRHAATSWHGASVPVPAAAVHELVAAQAAAHPQAIATVFDGTSLSYASLDSRASRLAQYLRALGVGPEVVVGLCLARGTELIVAMLAVLKTGGAYLPIDPDYPAERIALMLSDSRVSVLLARSQTLDVLPALRTPLVPLDDPQVAAAIAQAPATFPADTAHPDQLAYLMYTSGSTGRPKAIAVCHRDIVGLAVAGGYGLIGRDDVVAQASTTSFDAATFEIWGALANGAALTGVDSRTLLSPGRLGAVLKDSGITVMFLTTAVFNRLAAEAPDALSSLRLVLFGGEAVDPASVRRVLMHHPPRRVVHVYGPTETTTFAAWHEVEDAHGETIPIGRALANMRLLVLDQYLSVRPATVPGELYIGGVGVARGYAGRPALTAERFIADPIAADGSRLYRSGDVVRRRHDDSLEYLGRIDQQVKIRGFRIEPAEIEAALLRHQAIAHAIVLVRSDSLSADDRRERRLVAYLVPADPSEGIPSAGELRGYLRGSLPDFLVPAVYVELAALPVNRNGKVDRAALPAPDDARPTLATDFEPPRTPTETTLASLWAQILNLSQVGAMDNFFDLGGHSLLATQVVSRLRSAFGVELNLATLFDHPTIRQFAAVVDAATPGQSMPPIGPAPRDGALPLSYAQQRLWFLDQLEPDSADYNIPVTRRLRGPLNVAALQAALGEVLRRHEVLRTRLVTEDGVARQVIDPPPEFRLDVLDLAAEPDPLAAAVSAASADSVSRFDISADPLLRGRLIRLGADDHVLCLVMHHIVSDEWSAGVLRSELSALYRALSSGDRSPLRPLPVQYADYAVWQRQWLRGEVLDRQLDYWRDRLAAAPDLELPADRPRPALRTSAGALVGFTVPESTMAGLRQICQNTGVTMFMVLLAAFSVLVGRRVGQDDVLIGTPIANRNRSETEGLIGFFVNTLVLRTDLSGDPAFTELVGRVREVALDAYAHQDLPFERLVDALQPIRDRSRTPLFQVFFNHLGVAGGAAGPLSAELDESELQLPHTLAKFDLTLFTQTAVDAMTSAFEYRTDLFDRSTIERLAEHFTTLLAAIAADPRLHLSELSELTAAECELAVEGWNATRWAVPGAGGVIERVWRWASSCPDAVAVVCGARSVSYGELWARAVRLAGRLAEVGVGPESVVGVCLERSPDQIVALLAVWLAGGAYLPLDPGYPAERLGFLLADSDAVAVVGVAPRMPCRVAVLDPVGPGDRDAGAGLEGWPGAGNAGDRLAYVIYTSGSTGRPKGVLAHHGGLINRLAWMQEQYRLGPGERVLHKTPATFDVSLWELAWPLIAGGCLVLAAPGRQGDPGYLSGLIDRERVAVTHFVPSMFGQFAHHEWTGPMGGLRLVVCSGEALSGADVARFYARHRGAMVENLYGPTEAAIDVSWWSCPRPGDGAAPPIGAPIANTRLYVLDRHLRPVPNRVPGELFIAGAGLARGYAGRPALTAERFIADPVAADGTRLYRTGDRARWRADGQVEFLGRLDRQVKIRGYRIEPGEIEGALAAHPAIGAAVVTADPGSGQPRLAAYLVAADPAAGLPGPAALRGFLGQTLPDYLIPAVFTELAGLPLTPNGKLNRAALPAPDSVRTDPARYLAPRSAAEQVLADIWADLLGLPIVGITDNFFELGGDSILSIQVVSRARRHGLQLTPNQLFEHQTIAELAGRAARRAAGTPSPVQVEQGPVTGPVPLTPIQLQFLARRFPEPTHYNQSRLLAARRQIAAEPVRLALAAVVQHHDALRLRLSELGDGGGLPVQSCVAAEEAEVLSRVDLFELSEAEAEQKMEAAAAIAQTSLDLEHGPLVRAVLFDGGQRGQWLLLVIHHLAVDGVSWQILVEDLATAYLQAEAGTQVRLPAKTTSFQRWSHRLTALAASAEFAAEAGFWRSAASTARTPRDYAGGQNDLSSARTVRTELSAEQTDLLLHTVPAAYGTQINDALLTALAIVIGQWAGGSAVTIDLEGHGREDLGEGFDVSRTVGWFTTIFPVTVPRVPNDDLATALKQTKELLRQMPRRGLSYGALRYLATGEVSQELSAVQTAEVALNYLGQTGRGHVDGEPFQLLSRSLGPDRAPAGSRAHLIELDARIVGDRLELSWSYSDQVHDAATVERLARRYLEVLGELIEHCCSPGAGGYTPSDFPLAGLDQDTLDALQQRLMSPGGIGDSGGRS